MRKRSLIFEISILTAPTNPVPSRSYCLNFAFLLIQFSLSLFYATVMVMGSATAASGGNGRFYLLMKFCQTHLVGALRCWQRHGGQRIGCTHWVLLAYNLPAGGERGVFSIGFLKDNPGYMPDRRHALWSEILRPRPPVFRCQFDW